MVVALTFALENISEPNGAGRIPRVWYCRRLDGEVGAVEAPRSGAGWEVVVGAEGLVAVVTVDVEGALLVVE